MKALFLIGVLVTVVYGQVSVDIHIGDRKPPPERVVVVQPPQGYIEDYDPREDLIVIDANLVGYWVRLSSGRFVLHCRNVWYDDRDGRIFYGPWREDRHYVHRHDYVRYDNYYKGKHYPKCRRYHNGPPHDGPRYIGPRPKHHDDDGKNKHGHKGNEHKGHGR